MKTKRQKKILPLVLLCLLSAVVARGAAADEPSRLVILPFKVHAQKDLSFLKEGILDMLASRLSLEDKVAVVPREEIIKALENTSPPFNEDTARAVGQDLGADYILFGSLTMIGESLSLDGKLVDLHEEGPVLTFFKEGDAIDEVIPQIGLFAAEIKEKVFGVAAARTLRIEEKPSQAQDSDIYAHPETLIAGKPEAELDAARPEPAPPKESGLAESAVPSLEEGGFAKPPAATQAYEASSGFWASRDFKETINGIALGDVNGDRMNEVVFISDRRVFVHQFQDQGLVKLWERSGARGHTHIRVDVADINSNGLAEIFVTSIKNPGDRLGSFVLEWDGRTFQTICEDADRYFRVADLPYQGQVLLGQKRTMDEPFVREVYQLSWADGRYKPQEPLALPKGVNIFGFAQGDVTNEGLQTTVAFDREDHLRLFSLSGNQKWRSAEPWGGGMNYVESWVKNSDIADRSYLPQRIFVLDLDGDGKQEVVLPSNEGAMGRLFAKLRSFSAGHMASLSWNGLTLVPELQTPKLEGYISDFDIGDLDHDGEHEVVVAHVGKGRIPLIGSVSSKIISYEIRGSSSEKN